MTIDDLKKLDKRLREIQDPLGTGFPLYRKTFEELSKESGLPVHDLGEQYLAWKWRK